MRLLFIGDIVGKPGRRTIKNILPGFKKDNSIDYVIANGENLAGGNGITVDTAQEMFKAGINVLTSGNHVWQKRDIFKPGNLDARIIRPANYPAPAPGKGFNIYTVNNINIAVINLEGRLFMRTLNCPFKECDRILDEVKGKAKIIFVDFHAEATSEKIALGLYLTGKVSAVVGTHTHVQTSDERIIDGKTAYLTDAGMTASLDSVIGIKKEQAIERFLTQRRSSVQVARGNEEMQGAIIDFDDNSGFAINIKRVKAKDPVKN